jgi:hypothetical protein
MNKKVNKMYQIFEKEVVRNEFSTIPYQLIRGEQPHKTLCIMPMALEWSAGSFP